MLSIADKLLAKLEKDCLELKKGFSELNSLSYPYRVEIEEHNLMVRVDLLDIDRLGCSISQIIIQHKEPEQSSDNRKMEYLSHQIGEKITYLLENLALVEWDKNFSTLLMRSHLPNISDSYIRYYELVISWANSLSLSRYRYDRKAKSRTREPINLTREVFVRLIDDLAEIISQ